MDTSLVWFRLTGFPLRLLLFLCLLLHIGETEGATPSLRSAALEEEGVPEGGALGEVVVPVLVLVERRVLERVKRETTLQQETSGLQDTPAILTVEETIVVRQGAWGWLVLAVAAGACVGIITAFLLSLLALYCFLKCSSRGSLDFDQKHYTYRSADVIDGVV